MDPKIIRTRDRDGRAVVRVEISNHRGLFATMDEADFDKWVELGRDVRFLLNRNGPLTGTYRVVYYDHSVAGCIAGVARTIMQPGRGRAVFFRDADRLNLRRSNLEVRGGRAPGQSLSEKFMRDIESWAEAEQDRAAA